MRAPRNTDKEKAITLICKGVVQADMIAIRKMLCLAVGHPAAVKFVVNRYVANTTIPVCVRCGAHLFVNDLQGWENVGPNLWTMGKLTPTDLLLSDIPKVEKVAV